MKKIMFNDRYGLTQAVLDGRKTMTRRIINGDYEDVTAYNANLGWHFIADTKDGDSIELKPAYEIGEEVAIAQSYETIYNTLEEKYGNSKANEWWSELYDRIGSGLLGPGYKNKMFVRAEFMPHRIRITDIHVERLQDISDEDCMNEGIEKIDCMAPYAFCVGNKKTSYRTPKYAFSSLIDKVSGRGTWERNPWVFAYKYELIK